jgi:signal transduction histidine kinase/CheY-like chemotaxis protein
MTTTNPFPSDWQEKTLALAREMQRETLLLLLPVLGLGGLLVLMMVIWTNDPMWEIGVSAGLFALMAGLWRLQAASFRWASLLLVAGTWAAVLAVAGFSQWEAIIFLWVIPVGLVTMLLGEKWGLGVIVLSVACLWLPLPMLAFTSPMVRLVTILAMAASVGMIWLTLRPLLTAIHWSWSSYFSSQEALSQARTFQVQLQQSLQDVTLVNTQLKRLNQLTQSLRLEAENERRTKQEFVANVSHELRTPLNMIIGFSRTMLDTPETYGDNIPPKLLADLQVILRNSQHLSNLIDDVLDLSQIDADRMALNKERTALPEIIQEAVVSVRPLFESKGLYLETQIPPDLPLLWCDRTRIREVLLNLLSNAGRFTENGGVRLAARQDNAAVIVSVADTGLGISEEDRRKLFQPFQQVDGSIRRKYGGTGLGLSISKAFVELHDGEMWVDSAVGQGTTFYFKLPVDPLTPLPESPARWFTPYQSYDETFHVTELPAAEARPRLVVVEQGDVMQKIFSRYFDQLEIVAVQSLDAALAEMAQGGGRALLVNDVRIHEIVERFKDVNALPYGVPAILCSLPGIEQASVDLGVANYLIKPISREALLAAMDGLGRVIETILVVDDEPDARQLFRRMLADEQHGYRVLRASNGFQALEILQQEKVDAILLDLTMPGMDGFAFLEEREKLAAVREIPVILISARDPQGQPIASNILAVARGGGLTTRQVLTCVEALSGILSPGR